ncbi:MAG: dihydroneopterin aldolase [Alphaproteobacteria bacterium]
MSRSPKVQPLKRERARPGVRRVFIRDLVLSCDIGVHRRERGTRQRVRINLDLALREGATPVNDRIGDVVCYEEVADGVRRIASDGHVNLVETLAERIAAFCLEDPRVVSVKVRVEKLDVFPDAAGAGVEIERFNPEPQDKRRRETPIRKSSA